jgi:molecular chaperone IbpA
VPTPNGLAFFINLLNKEKTMTYVPLGNFRPLHHTTLGFERFFNDVERLLKDDQSKAGNFPPHNIIKLDDNRYVVELAIAGFAKDEIDVSIEDGNLVVKGEKKEKETNLNYVHRGIGTRSFTKSFTVADTIEVRGAEFKDGILRIGLENVIPDHKKPRKIEIGGNLESFKPQLLQEEKVA